MRKIDMREIRTEVFKEVYERTRGNKINTYLIVDDETWMCIKRHKEYIPQVLNPEAGKGDTFLGLKIAVRHNVTFGWEII